METINIKKGESIPKLIIGCSVYFELTKENVLVISETENSYKVIKQSEKGFFYILKY